MNKIVMTFEAYQTYNDYGKNAIQMPNELEKDVTLRVKHLTPTFDDKWISSIEDSSDEKKGIKFEIKISTGDILHAFKIGKFLGNWEWYLNKKKKSENEIKQYFMETAISPLERWTLNFKGFDSTYHFADDSRSYNSGLAHERKIISIYDSLTSSDKRKAYKIYTESGRSDIKPFAEFKGV